jgi:hypothetical protein
MAKGYTSVDRAKEGREIRIDGSKTAITPLRNTMTRPE